MTTVEENLTRYAAYHRDRRNIATHFAGVPMIVFATILALQTAWIPLGRIEITLAAAACLALCAYYLLLDRVFGVTMAVVLFAMCAAASEIVARMSLGATLALAGSTFVAGWALQFLGHKYEGMKPAFLGDVTQLAIGPLFVCAEAYFLLGAREELRRRIEERVGPTVARRGESRMSGDSPAAH